MNRLKLLLTIMLIMGITTLNARDLRKMDEAKRNKILIEEAVRVVKKYRPTAYRDLKPKVELYSENEVKQFIDMLGGVLENVDPNSTYFAETKHTRDELLKGRRWYEVTIPYDPDKEYCRNGYTASVLVWTDTHKTSRIIFGDMRMVQCIDVREKRKEKIEIPPFEKQPSLNNMVKKRINEIFLD